MAEFEVNRTKGWTLKEVLDLLNWSCDDLNEIWKLQPGDSVFLKDQTILRVK